MYVYSVAREELVSNQEIIMRTFLAAVGALALAVTAASAADLPMSTKAPAYGYPPAGLTYSWTGFYLGANVGYGDGYGHDTISGANALSDTIVSTGIVPATLDTKGSGWLGGGTVGYNWQVPQYPVVLGLEADFDWDGLRGSAGQTLTTGPLGFPASLAVTADRHDRWLSTIRGRVGTDFLSPTTLLYVTGGLAIASIDGGTTATLTTPFKALNASISDPYTTTKVGATVGGGIESAINHNWSWKAEYLFVDLGNQTGSMGTTILGSKVGFNTNQNLNESIVRGGLNYKF